MSHIKNSQGSMLITTVLASVIGATITLSITSWFLDLKKDIVDIDGKLEAMSVATSEWNKLNSMTMEDIEKKKDTLKDYKVGDYQIKVDLGDKGAMSEGDCKTSGLSVDTKLNCYNNSKVVIRKDGNTLYSSKLLPLVANGSDSGGEFKITGMYLIPNTYIWSHEDDDSFSNDTNYSIQPTITTYFEGKSADGTKYTTSFQNSLTYPTIKVSCNNSFGNKYSDRSFDVTKCLTNYNYNGFYLLYQGKSYFFPKDNYNKSYKLTT